MHNGTNITPCYHPDPHVRADERPNGKQSVFDRFVDPLDALRLESADHGYGIRLGRGEGERVTFVRPEHGLLALGPPRSGKTTTLVVPNVLAAGGPVVTTSTKLDVLTATHTARSRVGECLLFDPSGKSECRDGVRRIGWSPLASARSFEQAALTARAMVLTARPGGDRGDARHWTERAEALLAPAFHAAALDGMRMSRLLPVVDHRKGSDLRAILARHDAELPLSTFEGVLATEEREQSGIWSTASSILAAYRSPAALAGADGPGLDVAAFLAGSATLYVASGSDEQQRAAPVVAGVLREVRRAAYAASADGLLGAANRRPPLLLVLDEVANIAPLHDLPALVAEGGSQGVVTLACLQDLSQAVERWGRLGEGMLSLFNTKVVFPGIGDTRTLAAISLLSGEIEVPSLSIAEGARLPGLLGLAGRHSPARRTWSTRRERRLPVDVLARGVPGFVVCLDGASPSFVRAEAWFESPLLRAAAGREPPRHERLGGRAAIGSLGRGRSIS